MPAPHQPRGWTMFGREGAMARWETDASVTNTSLPWRSWSASRWRATHRSVGGSISGRCRTSHLGRSLAACSSQPCRHTRPLRPVPCTCPCWGACAMQRLVAMSGRYPFKRRTVRSRLSPTWPSLVSCTALVDLPGPRNRQTRVASLGSPFPLLAQEVLELVHQLLRVQVVVTPGTRRRVTRRVILLL